MATREIREFALREALGISKVSLWKWRRAGMPVISQGIAGQENVYDLAAVLSWLDETGYGQTLQSPDTAIRIAGLRSQLETPGRAAAGDDVARALQRQLTHILGHSIGDAVMTWAALLVWRHGLSSEIALDVIEDGLMVLNDALANRLGIAESVDVQLLVPHDLALAMNPEHRPALLSRIEKAAKIGFADESSAG